MFFAKKQDLLSLSILYSISKFLYGSAYQSMDTCHHSEVSRLDSRTTHHSGIYVQRLPPSEERLEESASLFWGDESKVLTHREEDLTHMVLKPISVQHQEGRWVVG